jgi:hypothetical protein
MGLLLFTISGQTEETYLDLGTLFDQDAFVQDSTDTPLDETAGSLDAGSLPESFVEGQPYAEFSGDVPFLFGNLATGDADSFRIDSQTLAVPAGNYDQFHMALLSVGSYNNLANTLQLNYADGSSEEVRFGPIANWFDSPMRYADRYLAWSDESGVESYLDLTPQQNDEEYIAVINGTSPSEPRDDYRFVDGTDSLEYEFDLEGVEEATLSVEMANNFVVGISLDYGATYTDVLNSQEMFGTDVHDSSNRDTYEVDLTPFLTESSDNILWLRFTDGTTENGWGPAVYNISVYSGEIVDYELEDLTVIDTESAEVYADFRTDGSEAEDAYIVDVVGTTVSGNRHRFADNSSYVVYQVDLPNEVTEAKAAINMEANFVVSVGGEYNLETLLEFVPGGGRDNEYIVEDTSADATTYRFVDGSGRLMYWLELPEDTTAATLNLELENNFVVSVGTDGFDFTQELNSFEQFGTDVHDASNRGIYEIDLAPYLEDNPSKEVFVLFEDGSTNDGWGPAIRNVAINTGERPEYTPVLTADDTLTDAVFAYDGTSTANKMFYEIDLTPFLQDNPEKIVTLKFSDATPENGWGPGLYRVLVYSGTIVPQVNELAIAGLTNTGEVPGHVYPWGVNLMRVSYDVDENKTLESVVLPDVDDEQDIYLFAATLTTTATSIESWSLF